MNKKRFIGLDLGTNSIGWALVEIDDVRRIVTIMGLGSRVIPMSEQEINDFEKGGKIKSSAANKTQSKSMRKNNYRFAIRRDRLHCVLNLLSILPNDYAINIDFSNEKGKRSGSFKTYKEPKLAYDSQNRFLFVESYNEMCQEFSSIHPALIKEKHGKLTGIPQDWTLYYLRRKALTAPISENELSWVIMSFLQRRGYEPVVGVDDEIANTDKDELSFKEDKICTVTDAVPFVNPKKKGDAMMTYTIVNKEGVKEIDASCLSSLLSVGNSVYLRTITSTDDEGNIAKKRYEISYVYTNETNGVDYETTIKIAENGVQTGRASNKKVDDKTNWKVLKVQSESEIDKYNDANNTVGIACYIYSSLLNNPNMKIHGGLFQTIDREYYRSELHAILNKQSEYHDFLRDIDKSLLNQAADLLYPHNVQHNKFLRGKDLIYLLCEDVVFYQRELKSKKSLKATCPFEYEHYEEPKHLKVTHKGNPFYQEFSLRDRINNIRITKNEVEVDGRILFDEDITDIVMPIIKEKLYHKLKNRKEVTREQLFAQMSALLKESESTESCVIKQISNDEYNWNFDSNYKLPCNPYRYDIYRRIKRVKGLDVDAFLDFVQHEGKGLNCVQTTEYQLWQLFYSVKKRKELENGLRHLLKKQVAKFCLSSSTETDTNTLTNAIYENLYLFDGYKNEYGKFSEKMVKKILPYMREGHDLSSACKKVYGYYNAGEIESAVFSTPDDIIEYIKNVFPTIHMNNPIVEKVVRETLFVIADIWNYYGEKDSSGNTLPLFDGINIEFGRELKKNSKQKAKLEEAIKENRKANERAIALLKELKNEIDGLDVNSASALRKMHIYEEGACAYMSKENSVKEALGLNQNEVENTMHPAELEEISKIRERDFSYAVNERIGKDNHVTYAEVKRYRLWMEQRYRSPYTGRIIPLSKIFDKESYEVDHIFPRKKITLNAMSNLVLCEAEVNKDKGDMTGMAYIKSKNAGDKTVMIKGKAIAILSTKHYEQVARTLVSDKNKCKILLSEDIPEGFTNSQGNNSQNIARRVKDILSAVISPKTTEGKYAEVLVTSGSVTNILKKDWHLNNVWNRLMLPRFERLNKWVEGSPFTKVVNGHNVPCVPEPYSSSFEIKRIDHRHHALDALIVALTTRSHIAYINTENSGKERYDLKSKWMIKGTYSFLPPCQYNHDNKVVNYEYTYGKNNGNTTDFIQASHCALQDVVVTFKQKKAEQILRERINWYKRPNEDGVICSVKEENLKDKSKYNVRIKMHDATLRGLRHERIVTAEDAITKNKVIVSRKVKEYIETKKKEGLSSNQLIEQVTRVYPYIVVKEDVVVTRWNNSVYRLDPSCNNPIKIEDIADKRICDIFVSHIKAYLRNEEDINDKKKYDEAKKQALSEAGIKKLNSIIEEVYHHKPIYKLQTTEAKGTARALSANSDSVKSKQFAKTADNPYKVLDVFEDDEKREFEIVDFMDRINNSGTYTELRKEPLFELIAGDLVYVPTEEEMNQKDVVISQLNKDRIYKFISTNPTAVQGKPDVNFMPHRFASLIFSDSKSNSFQLKMKVPGASKSVLQGELSITRADSRIKVAMPNIIGGACTQMPVIRDVCWKLEVDRLGNIINIIR